MKIEIIDIVLAAAALVVALAVAAMGALGLVVWLAGGKASQRNDHRATCLAGLARGGWRP